MASGNEYHARRDGHCWRVRRQVDVSVYPVGLDQYVVTDELTWLLSPPDGKNARRNAIPPQGGTRGLRHAKDSRAVRAA